MYLKQYKQRNFYTVDLGKGRKALISYQTLVGIERGDIAFLTPYKYSPTTSKQQTMYVNENNLMRVTMDESEWQIVTRETEELRDLKMFFGIRL